MLSPRLNVVPWLPPLLPPPGSYFLHLPLLSTLCTADFKPSLLLRLLPLPLPTFTILRSFSSSIHRSHPGRVFDAVSSAALTVHSFLKVQLSVDFSSVDVLVGRCRRRDSPERTSRYPFSRDALETSIPDWMRHASSRKWRLIIPRNYEASLISPSTTRAAYHEPSLTTFVILLLL